MEKRNYIWINGEYANGKQPVLHINNRSFAYGDGFFETIHAYGTEARYLSLHFNRITKSLRVLGMVPPPFLSLEFLGSEITRLLNKNRVFGSARIRLTFFRESGGFYGPTKSGIGITIETTPLEDDFYPLNQKGYVVDIYTDIRKPINLLSPLKSSNALLYVMAAMYKQSAKLDDCIIINDQNRIAEATSSNLFLVMGNEIRTPSLEEGCVAGVMRHVVINLAKQEGYRVVDNDPVEVDMLTIADEIFLTNAIAGIRWVVGLRHKRYFGVTSRKLSQRLNELTFPDQFKDGFSG